MLQHFGTQPENITESLSFGDGKLPFLYLEHGDHPLWEFGVGVGVKSGTQAMLSEQEEGLFSQSPPH